MSSLIACFRNLRMREQIIIVDLFIMILILSVLMITYFIQQTILFDIIQSGTKQITMTQERRSFQKAAYSIQNYLERKYQLSILNIEHIDNFFEYTMSDKDRCYNISQELFQSCVKSKERQDHKIKFQSNIFCYQSFINSDGITLLGDIDQFNKSISLLTQFSLLFDVTSETQLTIGDLPQARMMISYPKMYQTENFNISKRPWYISYLKMSADDPDKEYYYCPVYLSAFTKEYVLAAIKTIHDLSGTSIGYVRNTILLTDSQLATIPINIMLANSEGEVIFSSVESIKSILSEQIYIYNQSVTGFNQTDWQYIQLHGKTELSYSLCNGYSNTFCLFNKLLNSTVQVEALFFKKEQFNLVIFTNVTYEQELETKFDSLTAALTLAFIGYQWQLLAACGAMILITTALIHVIFIPMFYLMNNVKQHIKQVGNNVNFEIFKMMNSNTKPTNIFYDLNAKFLSLNDLFSKNQDHKCPLCLEIEQIKYNIKPTDIDYCKIQEHAKKTIDVQQIKERPVFWIKRRSFKAVHVCSIELIKHILKEKYCNNHK